MTQITGNATHIQSKKVDTTAPSDGEGLVWSNANSQYEPTAVVSGSHASDHERGGADEIDGDHLDIDLTPDNYTPTIDPAEAAHVDDLAAHLGGIDDELGNKADASHEADHVYGGSFIIDADTLVISYSPSAYTPSDSPDEVTTATELTSHLYGIDDELNQKSSVSHQAEHVYGGGDELDADTLKIDHTPSNYTESTGAGHAETVHLTSHLEGIDTALGTKAASTHAASHIGAGSDEIDGDKIDIDWNPTTYTPSTPAEGDGLDSLCSHLKGIDDELSGLGSPGAVAQIVNGRMAYSSATELKWEFVKSCHITLWNGTAWVIVTCSAEETAANTVNDMGDLDGGSTALAIDTIYDVFAGWNTTSDFDLHFAPWATSTVTSAARTAAWADSTAYEIGDRVSYGSNYYACINNHTSVLATNRPSTGTDWDDYWTDNGTDPGNGKEGLHQHNGVWVYADDHAVGGSTDFDGRKYRWLGIVYMANNSSTPNFCFGHDASSADIHLYWGIANHYNKRPINVLARNEDASTWTYATNTYRELQNGTDMSRGNFLVADPQTDCACGAGFCASPTAAANAYSYCGVAVDSVTAASTTQKGMYQNGVAAQSGMTSYTSKIDSIDPGWHYLTVLETVAGGNTMEHGPGNLSHGNVVVWI